MHLKSIVVQREVLIVSSPLLLAQGNKRAMMRLTELKQQKGVKVGRKGARPTRKDAETECIVM